MINKKIIKKINELRELLNKEGFYVDDYSPKIDTSTNGHIVSYCTDEGIYRWQDDIKLTIEFDCINYSQLEKYKK